MWQVAAAAFATESNSGQDFRSYIDQARFFLRKEWYEDARHQLELAVGTEDGRLDPEAWFLLAKVRYELGDLVGARFAADRALVHSRTEDQARQTHELLAYFEQKFGFVTVEGAYSGMTSQLSLTLESPIFDPDLKIWLNHVAEAIAHPVTLPYELGLPAGRYTISGIPVEVTAGSHQSIAPKGTLGTSQALAALELELGLGLVGYRAAGLEGSSPAPTAELSAGLPLGWLALGATASWSPQPYQTRVGESAWSAGGWSLGARAGAGIPLSKSILFRPSLSWRLASIPGWEVPCVDAGGAWSCSAPGATRDLHVYTSALGQLLGTELATSYRTRTGLGAGLKLSGELLFGALPKDGEAIGPEGPVAFAIEGSRRFGGGSWRLLGFASYGF